MSNCFYRCVSRMPLLLAGLLTACASPGEWRETVAATESPAMAPAKFSEHHSSRGSALTTPQARKMLLGKWYGIAENSDGVRKEWLVERAIDGTYRSDFRSTHPDGRISSQAEVGFWGVSGEVYFRIFRGWVMVDGMKLADPKNPAHYDAYQIEVLDSQHMRYRHLDKNRRYTMKKMPDSFRLPVVLENRSEASLKFEF